MVPDHADYDLPKKFSFELIAKALPAAFN